MIKIRGANVYTVSIRHLQVIIPSIICLSVLVILSLFNFLFLAKFNTVLTALPCYSRFPSDYLFLWIIFFSHSRFLEAIRTLGHLQNVFKHMLAFVESLKTAFIFQYFFCRSWCFKGFINPALESSSTTGLHPSIRWALL